MCPVSYFVLLLLMLIAFIQHLQEVPCFSSAGIDQNTQKIKKNTYFDRTASSDQNTQKIKKNTYFDRTILNMHKLPGWTPFASNLGGGGWGLAAVFGVVAI